MGRFKDIAGQRFGKLVALERVGMDKYHYSLWRCQCDCGNETVARIDGLLNGKIKSCHCLRGIRTNLTGQRFGHLVVIEEAPIDKFGKPCWKCICDCGNETVVQDTRLRSGNTKSCGCGKVKRIDMTGQRIGNLTVVALAGKSKDSKNLWKCRCECGQYILAKTSALTHSKVISCGCTKAQAKQVTHNERKPKGADMHLEGQRFNRLTVSDYVTSGEHRGKWHCICDCGNDSYVNASKLVSGHVKSCGCWISDIRKVKQEEAYPKRLTRVYHGMMERCYNKNNVAYPNYGGRGITVCDEWAAPKTGRIAFCAWMIENGYDDKAPRGQCTIDRIDYNKGYSPDNCRIADLHVQAQNHRYQLGAIPVRGVTYSKSAKKYVARIYNNGKRISLGTYDTVEEAAAARKAAELKYYGQVLD